MTHEHVDKSGVAELVIDNPPVNAYNLADIATLSGHLRGCSGDDRVRAVVLRDTGRRFRGGGDVKEVQNLPGSEEILGQTSRPNTWTGSGGWPPRSLPGSSPPT